MNKTSKIIAVILLTIFGCGAVSAQTLAKLDNYMAGSITANAFRCTTINVGSNLYLGGHTLYLGNIKDGKGNTVTAVQWA